MNLVPRDFENPCSFFTMMPLPDDQVYEWLRMQWLLASTIPCTFPNCGGEMYLSTSSLRAGSAVYNTAHTYKELSCGFYF